MRRKGQMDSIFSKWFALVGIVFLAVCAPILTEVFDVVNPMFTTSGMGIILAMVIPILALGVIWNIIIS